MKKGMHTHLLKHYPLSETMSFQVFLLSWKQDL